MIPKLRIQSFSGDWIEVKIGDVYRNLKTGNTPSRRVKDYFKGNIPWVTSGELNRGEIFETVEKITPEAASNTNLKLYPIGTFFMAITGLEAPGTRGKCGIIQIPATTNQSCLAFEESDKISNRFLFHWYLHNSERLYQRFAQGTKQESYNNKIVSSFRICIPSRKEQNEITHLLDLLDQKINLLTKKKEALETYKKGLMQKIFSQELRFKREDGTDYPEWETETLDKLCSKCKSGGTPKSTIAEYYDGDIPFLAISDITEQGKYLRSTSKSISELGIENSASWIVPKHSLIYSMYASVGFVSINLIPLATSQAVLNLIVDERICLTEYLYYWLYQFQKNVHVYVTTGTQGNLNAQTVKSFQVDLPCIKEQEKIILTLSKIDEQISLMHTQIENAATLKKGLLQQMFV